jgi:hypothetical protein
MLREPLSRITPPHKLLTAYSYKESMGKGDSTSRDVLDGFEYPIPNSSGETTPKQVCSR